MAINYIDCRSGFNSKPHLEDINAKLEAVSITDDMIISVETIWPPESISPFPIARVWYRDDKRWNEASQPWLGKSGSN